MFYVTASTFSLIFYTEQKNNRGRGKPLLARQILSHQPWDSRLIPNDCDGYFYALVAISGSIESLQFPPPTRVVDRGSGGQ